MPSKIVSIHDRLFRQSMTDTRIAQDFFAHHLPEWLQSITTLAKLVLQPDSFVSPHLKSHYTDLLYTVPIRGETGYLYLLAEHKSYPSRFLSLQLLEYMTAIWRNHLKQHPKSETLPLIYPVTYYHGRQSPYPYSPDLLNCFDRPDLAKKILHAPWQIIGSSPVLVGPKVRYTARLEDIQEQEGLDYYGRITDTLRHRKLNDYLSRD